MKHASRALAWLAIVASPSMSSPRVVAPQLRDAWTADGNQAISRYGESVSGAGDVNGDGFDDVIVGAIRFDTNPDWDEGRAFVYLGSAFGPAPSPAWTASSGEKSVWLSVSSFGGAAAAAAFLAWFAIVARGRSPRGLRDLVAYALGYAAQAGGYLFLLTPRYPSSDPALAQPYAELPEHPVRVVVTDDLARPRLTVFFRLFLVIPHLVWLTLWSIVASLAAVSILIIGGSIGATAGYFGGLVDTFLMRLADVLLSIPVLVLLILVSSFYQPSPMELAMLIALVSWASVSRLIRGEVISLKHRDFIDAAKVMGASNSRIILKHLFPNIVPLIIVWASLVVSPSAV